VGNPSPFFVSSLCIEAEFIDSWGKRVVSNFGGGEIICVTNLKPGFSTTVRQYWYGPVEKIVGWKIPKLAADTIAARVQLEEGKDSWMYVQIVQGPGSF
jgi:hypothetical protein